MTRLDHLRAMRARLDLEIDREEAYQRRIEALRNEYRGSVDEGVWSDRIIAAVTMHYGLAPGVIASPTRNAVVTEARHIACWLLRDAGRTYPEIGRRIGRDHTSAIYGVRKVDESPLLTAAAKTIRGMLSGRVAS